MPPSLPPLARLGLVPIIAAVLACSNAGKSGDRVAAAQAPIDCRRCEIRLEPVVTIRDTDGDTLVTYPSITEFGGMLAVAPVGEDEIGLGLVDRDGMFRRIIGRSGDGPGEVRMIKGIATSRNGRQVVVMGNGRLTLFDSSFTPLRQVNDPSYVESFRLIAVDGGFVVNNYAPWRQPLIFLDDTLGVRTRWGVASSDADSNQYQLAPASSGGLWAARGAYRYEIVKLGGDGAEQRRLLPERDWFPPWTSGQYQPRRNLRTQGIQPRVTGIWELDSTRLVVALLVPDSTKTFDEGAAGSDGQPPLEADEFDQYLDVRIELIDARTGALLAEKRVDRLLSALTTTGKLWGMTERADTTILEIVQLVVDQ